MNSAFEENINFFQTQINYLTNQVSNMEQNVNQKFRGILFSTRYFIYE